MRKYKEKDYSQIVDWCLARDMEPPPPWSMPTVGYIVDDVAVGFLIRTDNGFGILDYYISNPKSDWIKRSEAIDFITNELIKIAGIHKVKILLCNSKNSSIKRRALGFGFEPVGEMTNFRKVLCNG